eukprot:TRINITY_DN11308_c0_g1_i1.p1 TRINITY_DN11308_c0_g1~~TRINITY_DN11308_c0_g1_i1.p1  ORF type:complete len:1226 (-),score=383.78 TRINITY_DN11308_c0_g1_i1:67-3744(-)
MENPAPKKKSRLRLSKLLSYVGCASRPRTAEEGALVGGPGFSRVVYSNAPERHASYPLNAISTTKYNLLSFFPIALLEQFRRVANIYFLLAAVVSFTPVSPYEAISLVAPLLLVLGVSMIKEALEDYRRWMQDKSVNGREVQVLEQSTGEFALRKWRELRVGDLVRVEKDNFFPADLLLLSSSFEDGVCYVETMNLDGETNLKLRKASESTCELDGQVTPLAAFDARISCEDPNPSLYTFVGNMEWQGSTLALSPQQILLRDSKLRNTGHILGCVIFTGHDTKVMQNATKPRSKRSRIEKRMDSVIYLLFGLLLLLCFSGAIVFGLRTKYQTPKWWYLRPDDATVYWDPQRAALAGILQACTGILLYSYLIPISLYVSIEIVKVFQAALIQLDAEMYHLESDTPARARTSNLNEELGQIDTILSDKTGTLTCNQMEFLKCSIGGVAYGRGITEVELATAKRLGKDPRELEEYEAPEEEGGKNPPRPKVKGFAFRDERIMQGSWVYEAEADRIAMFLVILSVCHTAIPEVSEATGEVSYEAESPDEASFVVAAQQMGYEFFRRTQGSVFVRHPAKVQQGKRLEDPVEREYKVLHVLEFNSTRKRMSVVIRDPEGRIRLLTKGADSVIFERLSPQGRAHQEALRVHLGRYGDAGLRTLVLAYRDLDPSLYKAWSADFTAATTSLSADRERLIDAASEAIEQELVLVGATAVEDKLQHGVPETIDRLARAGIKLWVLTGDKMETAINIGFACSLLRDGMTQIVITLDTPEVHALEDAGDKEKLKEVCTARVAQQVLDGVAQLDAALEAGPREGEDEAPVFALVIDGKSLAYALTPKLEAVLLALAMRCASVICCRVSPKQKALVTRLVKKGTGRTCLGIGDGANDVGMIQEADIGVGISGVEGQQAVMASDFAIAQFRFLERLLLVHGHWCYKRIANMITYFFYKNLVFGMCLFYYNGVAVFSGQIAFNSWYSAVYNVFFTSLPVICLGIFEQDVSAKLLLQFPTLYSVGPANVWFNWSRILLWMLNGIYGSVISFWFACTAFSPQAFRADGALPELSGLSIALYSSIVWAVNLQLFYLDYLTWLHHLLIFGSISMFYVYAVVYGFMDTSFSTTGYKIFTEVLARSLAYWLFTLLTAIVQLLPYFVYKVLQVRFLPLDYQIIQELRSLHKEEDVADGSLVEGPKASVGFSAAVDAVVKRMARKNRFQRGKVPPRGQVLEKVRAVAAAV